MVIKMVDKPKEEGTVRTNDRDVYETMKENSLRTVDEIAKIQPQYSQSISNLQLDYIQTVKNMINTAYTAQKQIASSASIPVAVPYTEQFVKQANEITNNTIRSVGINNQLTINALDAARENLKIFNRTVDAVTEFNTNVVKAWTSFYSVQQQQFFRQ